MKVSGQQQPQNVADLAAGKTKDKGQKTVRNQSLPVPDTDNATNRTSLETMARIKETIRNEPDVRAERVAELKSKVKSGEYKVDSDKLAKNMLIASLKEDLERP